jgi:hypothetical protein
MEPEKFTESNKTGSTQEESAKPTNFFTRLAGVFFSPRETFTEIERAPRILIPIIAIILVGAISTWYITAKVAPSAIIADQLGGIMGSMTDEQRAAIEQSSRSSNPISSAVTGGISSLILCLFIAGYGKIFSLITSAENQYKSLLEVSLYVMTAVSIVSTILTVIILQIKAPGSAIVYEMPSIASNLGVMIETVTGDGVLPKFIMGLAKAVDIFNIWMIALLSIGFSAVSTKLKTSTAAIWFGGIYAIIYICIAAVSSMFSA